MELQEKVVLYKEEVIKSIQEAVKIKSILGTKLPNMPFGKGPAEALEYFLDLGKKLGFKVENFNNYVGTIEFGDGEETLGILAHVDVVPEGEGWSYPPYSAKIVNNKIIGRGVLDNKGPAIISLYAMKAISDLGIKLNKKVKMYLGTNEETDSKCMEYYFENLKMPKPDIAFTPDATFPVTYGEKGIICLKLLKKFNSIKNIKINGGSAFNCIPEITEISIPIDYLGEVKKELEKYNNNNPHKIELELKENIYYFISHGTGGAAANPALGYNSISAFFDFIKNIEIKNKELQDIVDFFNKYIKKETNGKSLGIYCKDKESGELTVNLGRITLEDNNLEIWLDIRCPIKISTQDILGKLKQNLEKEIKIEVSRFFPSVYVSKESFLVSTLMKIYQDFTGDKVSQPRVIGGRTYSRAVKNCVAFGALLLDQEDNMHKPNESLEIEKIDILLKIFSETIYQLAK